MPKDVRERIIDYPASRVGPGRASTTTAGATSTATTLGDHNHLGAAGSGGTLSGYAPIIHTHVEADITDLDHTQPLQWVVCTEDAIVINAGEVVWQR